MLKMMLDPMGGIVITNDGHAILRELDVAHPAAKSMLELARAQDEEVGDGTTSVIILGASATQPPLFLLLLLSLSLAHADLPHVLSVCMGTDTQPSCPSQRASCSWWRSRSWRGACTRR